MKILSFLAMFLVSLAAWPTTVTKGTHITIGASGACPITVGTLTLNAAVSRSSGVSPLLVFFDATSTTDSVLGATRTAFNDVYYSWSYGDTNASGTGTWANGASPGGNSMNASTGAVGAHLYIVPEGSGDATFQTTITAYDGTNTASCVLSATVYDPAGANGFPTTATTCAYNTTLGSGCPAGATTLQTSSYATALGASYMGNGKRVLFKCGDTFTGDNVRWTATKFSIGAYGGCQGTTTNRPIFNDSGTGGMLMPTGNSINDGRVADIDFEGPGLATGGSAFSIQLSTPNGTPPSQITWYNLNSNNVRHAYSYWDGNQMGFISTVMQNMGATAEGTYPNYNGNNCTNGSAAFNCGNGGSTYVKGYYVDISYSAILGNLFNGASYSTGYETFRMEACRLCAIENNTFENAGGSSYAVMKLHNGNTNNSNVTWTGQYTELVEISDNLFTGHSGAQLTEVCPENAQDDERLQNIVIERNVFNGSSKPLAFSGNSSAIRDNVFYNGGFGASIAKRGIEFTGTAAAPSDASAPQLIELYNNTCYNDSTCIGLNTNQGGWGQPGANSWAINNLVYNSGGGTAVNTTGSSGNTVNNNTSSVTANPNFVDASGTFLQMSDYQPQANYTGGTSVPNWYDALGVAWSPTWALGAINPPGAPSQAATPTFSPSAGTYASTQTVSINDVTPSPTIHYTTDNSTPTVGSAVYGSPLTVSSTETVKAIATAPGYATSNVGNATYTISGGGGATRPGYNTGTGFFVLNGVLYDANGNPFVPIGVNILHGASSSSEAAGIKLGGGNAARAFVSPTYPTSGTSVATYVAAMNSLVSNKLVPIPSASAFPDGTTASCNTSTSELTAIANWWATNASSWSALSYYQLLNIANEWGPANSTVWRDSYISAISAIRTGGYTGTLLIDSGGCGQDMADLVNYSTAVFNSDPQKNIVFSLHIYGNIPTASVAPDLAQLAALSVTNGAVYLVGEFGPGNNIGPSPTATTPTQIVNAAQANGLGWLGWAWDDNNLSSCGADNNWFAMLVNYCSSPYTGLSNQLTNFGQTMVPLMQADASQASIF